MSDFASAPRTCAVLQAAYTAASGAKTLAYPPVVLMEDRRLHPEGFVTSYPAELPLSRHGFDDLVAEAKRYDFPNFKPACAWQGSPGPRVDGEGTPTFVSFTSPIFSSDGRLAILQVSFRIQGWGGHGEICVVRQHRRGWRARCRAGWMT
ncbi:hypothetical protein GCM10011380_09240 [Sphingomonas metalli]|uniref:Uncharacterized protein n=1 Tax=Sphingomonas metalli TaxID=1779358 RepID=A0A916WR46_9SPHN|nr:hypothetical protein [Sphingomonas metalli]GGB21818.1 hypothetical protein GCM10011380_09240 [Sphingomonas metalli]